ncbi:erythromycin esterase family protein [Rufibacter glacialis]|nr:erythromycin esterase family protein [Rufibacter glacialis]GGK80636.1 hypothetical protein GCM10011405_30500 [Rufibacter glacialis]
MRLALLPALLFSLSFPSLAQEKAKGYIQNNTVPVATISPDSRDYSDLEAIGNAIADSRIVLLGEQSHGDGATMLAKSRLVRYLHEKKGFDVLAFEGDFFGLNTGWGLAQKDSAGVRAFLTRNLPPMWSSTAQCASLLYSFLPATYLYGRPMEITGFDSQVGYAHSNASLRDSIDQYLRRLGVPYTRMGRYEQLFLPSITRLKEWTGKTKEGRVWMEGFALAADTVLAQLGPTASDDFGYLMLENARAFARQLLVYEQPLASYIVRDTQMARNLRWLAQVRYPNRKVIVWAANSHIMKNAGSALKGQDAAIRWMGTQLAEDPTLERQAYTIGFASRQGTYRNGPKLVGVPKPLKDGFETWVADSMAYGFVDFRRFRRENPSRRELFMMKGSRHMNATALWTKVFDGVFYIRDMEPTVSLKP